MAKSADGKRRDSKHRILRTGESIRSNGKYQFKYHIDGKPHFVYSWRLEPTDPVPAGKTAGPSLRELEKQIGYDQDAQMDPLGKNITVKELVTKYLATKTNAGTRKLPMTEDVYRCFATILEGRGLAAAGPFALAFMKNASYYKVKKVKKLKCFERMMVMEIAKISSKGQITIPVYVRNKLKLNPGDKIVIFEENGRFYFENSAMLAFKRAQEAFAGEASKAGFETEDDMQDYMKEIRKDVRGY